MKKMIVMLAFAVSSFASYAGSTFSKPIADKGEEMVSKKVLDAFKSDFNTVKDVEWSAGTDFYKASFVYNEKHVFAYYDLEGDLLGLTRYISPIDLPLNLQMGLKKYYNGYWISDLFEVAKNETTSYYITIENADTKIVLKSTGDSGWQEFKSVKKS